MIRAASDEKFIWTKWYRKNFYLENGIILFDFVFTERLYDRNTIFCWSLLFPACTGQFLWWRVCDLACADWSPLSFRKGYREVDEDETFLPRNDNASPSYYRYGGSEPPGSCSDSLHEDTPATWVSSQRLFGGTNHNYFDLSTTPFFFLSVYIVDDFVQNIASVFHSCHIFIQF